MRIDLENYKTKIKSKSFMLINEEDSNGSQFLLLICLNCKSESKMTMKVKKEKKDNGSFILPDDDIFTISDLVEIKDQKFLFCPICGFHHNIINVEVITSNKTDHIYVPEQNDNDIFDLF